MNRLDISQPQFRTLKFFFFFFFIKILPGDANRLSITAMYCSNSVSCTLKKVTIYSIHCLFAKFCCRSLYQF